MLRGQVGSVLLEEPGRLKLQDCVGGACRIAEISTQKPEGAGAVQQKQVGPLALVAPRFSGVDIRKSPFDVRLHGDNHHQQMCFLILVDTVVVSKCIYK